MLGSVCGSVYNSTLLFFKQNKEFKVMQFPSHWKELWVVKVVTQLSLQFLPRIPKVRILKFQWKLRVIKLHRLLWTFDTKSVNSLEETYRPKCEHRVKHDQTKQERAKNILKLGEISPRVILMSTAGVAPVIKYTQEREEGRGDLTRHFYPFRCQLGYRVHRRHVS